MAPCKMPRSVPASFSTAIILAAVVWRTAGAVNIPDNLTTEDLSTYTIRYLSTDGRDTEACLSSAQDIQVNSSTSIPSDTIQYCGSLLYALTGGNTSLFENDGNNARRIMVLVTPGVHLIGEGGIILSHYQSIILSKTPDASGEVVFKCNGFLEAGYNNLYFFYTRNVILNEIVFTECGSFISPVNIQLAANVTVSKCVFRKNRNCGLTVGNSEQIYINSCWFHDNNSSSYYMNDSMLDPGVFRFGGGLLLLWNSTGRNGLGISSKAIVENCKFFKNYAGSDTRNTESDTRPHFYHPRGHGGAIVIAFKSTSNHMLVIKNTQIYENNAIFGGGGIILSFFRNAVNNTVQIMNTSFVDNTCTRDGGAINMNAFESANENYLTVINSTFERNVAIKGKGGAANINLRDNLQSTSSEVNELITNTATFTDCTFINNTSPAGAGVYLVSNLRVDQLLAATEFTNCLFYGNKAERQSAVLSFRYPIKFMGMNMFKANQGGGVTLQQTNMDVSGTLHFEENSAKSGGAISLEDLCVIYLLEGSNLTFIRNTAETQGGAISALFPSNSNALPVFNTRCFIQYKGNIELDSSEWNATLAFINNTAEMDGAAIYATSITQCIYTNKMSTGTVYENSIFQVSPTFSYTNTMSTADKGSVMNLATAPSELRVTTLLQKVQNFTVAPGETVEFLVMAVDQAGNPREAIWSVTEKSDSEEESTTIYENNIQGKFFGSLADGTNYSHHIGRVNKDVYYGSCTSGIPRSITFSLVQAITGMVSNETTVEVNITCCHPGYLFDDETEVCRHDHDDTNIVRPGPNKRYLYTKDNIYVDKQNTTEELKTAAIPPTFHKCEKQGVQPGCKYRFDSPQKQCSGGREGFLCGQCPGGKWVDLTLRQCRDCTTGHAIIVGIIVVGFIITSLLVLYFNIGVPNELRGCLFFVQVVGFMYQSSRIGEITWDYHLSRVFGSGLYLPLCPKPGFPALYTAIYGLLFSLLSIAILLIYIISARFSSRLSSRTSFDGIWLLSIITYKYTADTCFNLLRCQKVSGKGISGEFVYYFDGTVTCFQSTHVYISIVAVLLSIVVVVPFPLLILVISYRTFKFTQPFTDVLNKDIKTSCRWWSGFDLLRRLLFISVVFLFNYVQPRYTQLALFFTGLLTYFIFAIAKPYKTKKANIIEAMVLFNLLLITTFFLDGNLSDGNQFVRILEQILLLLPFLSILLYIVICLVRLIWRKVSRKSFKILFKDMKRKHNIMLHKTVSHDLKLIANMETEETTDSHYEDSRSTGNSSECREELLEN